MYRQIKEKMTRVIIVDNEATFRKGLKTILQNIGDVDIVAEASNGEEFLALLNTVSAELVFMDVKMPVLDGFEATRRARAEHPDMTIIAFSSYETQDYIDRMIEAGADGYLSKSADNYDSLVKIVNNVNAGDCSGARE